MGRKKAPWNDEKWQATFAAATDCICILDKEQKITLCNNAMLRLVNKDINQVIGHHCWEIVHGTTGAVPECPVQRMSKSRLRESAELKVDSTWYEVIVDPIFSERGSLMGTAHMIRDISERKKAEMELRLRANLLDSAMDAIIVDDFQGNILYANETAYKSRGYTKEEFLKMNIRQLLAPEYKEGFAGRLKKIRATGSLSFEVAHICKDGSLMPIEVHVKTVEIEGEKVMFTIDRDITERKRVELVLKNREDMLQRIFDILPVGLWFADKDGNLLRGNPAGVKIWGAEPKVGPSEYGVFKGRRLPSREEVAPDDWALVHSIRDKVTIVDELLEIDAFDGKKKTILNYTAPVLDAQGDIQGAIVVNQDITERKKAERALEQAEENFRRSLEDSPLGTRIVDTEGLTVYANKAVLDMLGFGSLEELDATPRIKYYTPESYTEHRVRVEKRQRGEGVPAEYEISIVHKTGEVRQLQVIRKEVLWNGARQTQVAYIDVTERRQLEERLKKSESKYRRIVETAMEGIIQTDKEGTITFINQRIEDMLDYTAEELIGQPLTKFIFEEDVASYLERRNERQQGISGRFESRLKRKDGSAIWVFTSITDIKDEAGQFAGTFGLLTDITDRKNLEEERQRVEKLGSIGVLAGGIAHDFNNILTAILGNISLAKMEAKPDSELHDSLEEAEKASLRAKGLTQQLLTFSKGGAPIKKLASLSEIIKDTTNFALRGSNVKCHISIPDDLWHAEVDEGQVSQVINNLVINANQAMPEGGTMEVRAENIVLTEQKKLGRSLPLKEGNYIRIAVIDHGIGIQEKHLAKIFDPFFTTKQKGSGLGLATSFSIVHNHGGHLGVKSKFGSGSTFFIYLPASMETAASVKMEDRETTQPVKARILVMDDEDTVREVASRMLKHIGCEDVELAKDGAEAIKLYDEAFKAGKPFDAVILDLTIPGGMGGRDTLKKLLEINPEVKAIISSGYSGDSVVAEHKKYGFRGVVAKPYTIDQLREALQYLLG